MADTFIPLPVGYSVRENRLVGYDYLDAAGVIVLQHPKDSDSARRLVWQIYKERLISKQSDAGRS